MIYTPVTLEEEATLIVGIWIAFHTDVISQKRVVGVSRNDLQPSEDGRRGNVNIWMTLHTTVISQQRVVGCENKDFPGMIYNPV